MLGNQSPELNECHTGELGGDGHDHNIGILDGFGAIASGGDGIRQLLDRRQANTIAPIVPDILDDFRFTGPHGHVIAGIRQHLAESSTPCSCTENRYFPTHIKFLPSLVAWSAVFFTSRLSPFGVAYRQPTGLSPLRLRPYSCTENRYFPTHIKFLFSLRATARYATPPPGTGHQPRATAYGSWNGNPNSLLPGIARRESPPTPCSCA